VGSGVAGLTGAYVLSAHDEVTPNEADRRLGGHAHTHVVDGGDGEDVALDSAFLVHNDKTYPTLCRLFAELGIETRDTDMSMSVRDDRVGRTGLEYAGARGIGGLLPSPANLVHPDICECRQRSSDFIAKRPGCSTPRPASESRRNPSARSSNLMTSRPTSTSTS
jgi:predicted NAD/FAD-binding protein